MTYAEAEIVVKTEFLTVFRAELSPAQVSVGTQLFDWPVTVAAVQLSVYPASGGEQDTMGAPGDRTYERRGEAMLEVRVPDDGSGRTVELEDLVQLFVDTFEGKVLGDTTDDLGMVRFDPMPPPTPPGQDGRWVTKICTAPFFFVERR